MTYEPFGTGVPATEISSTDEIWRDFHDLIMGGIEPGEEVVEIRIDCDWEESMIGCIGASVSIEYFPDEVLWVVDVYFDEDAREVVLELRSK